MEFNKQGVYLNYSESYIAKRYQKIKNYAGGPQPVTESRERLALEFGSQAEFITGAIPNNQINPEPSKLVNETISLLNAIN